MVKFEKEKYIAAPAVIGIALHLILRFIVHAPWMVAQSPLWVVLTLGGVPLVWDLLSKLFKREFGSDLLAGISIVTSIFLGQHLAGHWSF